MIFTFLIDGSSNEESGDDDEGGELNLAVTARGGGKSKLDEGNGRDKQPLLARSALPILVSPTVHFGETDSERKHNPQEEDDYTEQI